ncbi:MAG: prepilin-type N-terminal cleavage/methylation domain-containing protein [Candidatus Saccharimonadales bacterium]
MRLHKTDQNGFTLVELTVAIVIMTMIVISMFGLFISLVQSAVLSKEKSAASALATNQIEYLKSLPYDELGIQGGSISVTNPLPASKTQTLSGVVYTIKTDIKYVDDAYDGCGSYPDLPTKMLYCRNYPPPSGAPATDLNPADYKIINVSVYDHTNTLLAGVDTQISARVAETASNTGALFVKVIDQNGNPVSGATVSVSDTSLTPHVNVADSSDGNGETIFYDLPPDTSNYNYTITASLNGYSTLSTILPSGSLQPNYSSQKLFAQQSSNVTLTLKPQGINSLVIESTDVSGNPLPNAKIYVKGGYKKYTSSSDTQYYFDTLSPSDIRPVTDSGGLASLANLVPGPYIFCGDDGSVSCKVGNTTYYLAAAIPYGGINSFNPISVPTYVASSPPTTTYPYNGNNYLQKVRLMLTTNSNYPRVQTLTPSSISLASTDLSNFAFTMTGANLPCSASAGSCSTSIVFSQSGQDYNASCTGAASGTSLNCTADLTGISTGNVTIKVSANGYTLTLPDVPLLAGINVTT